MIFFSSNLVKLDLDLDPDPRSEKKLLDPDQDNMNADPQPLNKRREYLSEFLLFYVNV